MMADSALPNHTGLENDRTLHPVHAEPITLLSTASGCDSPRTVWT